MQLHDKIRIAKENSEFLYQRLEECDLCPRNCRVNRLEGKKGYCGMGRELIVYTAFLHQGEEPAISGKNGSGTIFFSGCSLKCIYCQNYKFSHELKGKIIAEEGLAKIILALQNKGAHNINLVTPTHFLPQILKALAIAFENGLKIPIIYNTSGYEKKEIIEAISELIDIYLPDIKYVTPFLAKKYSNAQDYPLFNQEALKAMHSRKTPFYDGDLLKSGVVIRHLVLPGYLKETAKILSWIKENTPEAIVSIMFQYQPFFKANTYPEINRKITKDEYKQIQALLEDLELEGWIQDQTPAKELAGIYFNQKSLRAFCPVKRPKGRKPSAG